MGKDYPEDAGRGVRLMKPGLFLPQIRDSVFGFAGVLTGVGALVLLLACVNLASDSQCASRSRLVRRLLTESISHLPCGRRRRRPALWRKSAASSQLENTLEHKFRWSGERHIGESVALFLEAHLQFITAFDQNGDGRPGAFHRSENQSTCDYARATRQRFAFDSALVGADRNPVITTVLQEVHVRPARSELGVMP